MPFSALEVLVPATTANLGAGYDLIGVALKLYNRFQFQPHSTFEIQLQGAFCHQVNFPLDTRNLVYRVMARCFEEQGRSVPPFRLQLDVQIPPARGLGSSSTAIVAGLLAAHHWLDCPFSQSELLAQAIAWEGHPDNVAPALLGGCVLNLPVPDGSYYSAHVTVPRDLFWVICYPDFELSTAQARAVVPEYLNRVDCVRNTGYLASLVAGFSQNDDTLITLGLQDCLHQPARQTLIPGMQAVMASARDAGALGAVLSGAGPSLLALCRRDPERVGQAVQQCWMQRGISCDYVITNIDTQGAQVLY